MALSFANFLKSPEDWYRISQDQILQFGGKPFLMKHESFLSLLMTAFPDVRWIPWKFTSVPNRFLQMKARLIVIGFGMIGKIG